VNELLPAFALKQIREIKESYEKFAYKGSKGSNMKIYEIYMSGCEDYFPIFVIDDGEIDFEHVYGRCLNQACLNAIASDEYFINGKSVLNYLIPLLEERINGFVLIPERLTYTRPEEGEGSGREPDKRYCVFGELDYGIMGDIEEKPEFMTDKVWGKICAYNARDRNTYRKMSEEEVNEMEAEIDAINIDIPDYFNFDRDKVVDELLENVGIPEEMIKLPKNGDILENPLDKYGKSDILEKYRK
jgi:hypothetical protein